MIVFVLGKFPCLSETFILNEIESLQQAGLQIRVLAIANEQQRKHDKPSLTIPALYPGNIVQQLAAHFFFISRRTGTYFAVFKGMIKESSQFSRCRISWTLKSFLLAIDFLYQIRNQSFRHVHAHFISLPAAVAKMMARISGKSYSATAHAHDIFVNSESAIKEFIDTSSFIITCTRYNKKRLEEIAGNGLGNNILHLYHGIDTSKWPQKKTVSQAGAAIKIIAVGRLVEKKGFAFLLKAVLLLKNWNTNISCTIAGDGPQHDQLNKFVEDNHLQNNVFLPGAVAHTEIAKYYLEADIMVLPSIVDKKGDMDGLPNVLLEAIWVGLPVISTSVSAIEELVEDKKTGLIVPPADEHAIANGILTLGQDAVLRAYLVNNGREKIKRNFSIQQTTQTLSAIFKDLR